MLEHTQIVPASAILLLAFGLGTVVGPIGGAMAIQVAGPRGLFWFIATTLALLAGIAVKALLRQIAPPVAEQTHCIGIAPVSTPVLMELDPRNEDFEPLAEPSPEPENERPFEVTQAADNARND